MTEAKPTPPAAAVDDSDLSEVEPLDSTLADVRSMLQHPYYRNRLLGALDEPIELGTLRVLRAVERYSDGPPAVGEVASALGIDPSTASRMVNRTVELGLLSRRPSPADRRRMRLEFTDKGLHCLRQATEARRSLLSELTDEWSAEDRHRFVTLMRRMLDTFWELSCSGGNEEEPSG